MRIKALKPIIAILILSIIFTCSSCESVINADTNDTVLSIGKTNIPLGEALVLILGYRDNTNATYGENIWNIDLGEISMSEYFQDEAKQQIALCFAGAGLADQKGTKLSVDEQKLVQSAADYYSANLSAEDKKTLGLDDKKIYNIFYSYRIALQCYNDITSAVDTEVSKDDARVISLMQIKLSKEGLSEEEISAKKSKIEEAYTKAKSGEDFSALISKYNESSESSITVQKSDLCEEEAKAAFNLNQDEISEIIETDNSFVIYKCTNPYNDTLSADNRQKMIKDKKDDSYLTYLNNYLASNNLDWNEEVWNEIDIQNLNYQTNIGFFDVYNMFFSE